jgi:hypothetical protein
MEPCLICDRKVLLKLEENFTRFTTCNVVRNQMSGLSRNKLSVVETSILRMNAQGIH